MTSLLLIRHAHVNTESRLCGCYDVPLSSAGRGDLEALVNRRSRRPAPDALYTSPLIRAHEVATALGRVWRLQPHIIDAVREIHCGTVEGMRLADFQRLYPEAWASNLAQVDEQFTWPEGEDYCGFRTRVLDGLRNVARLHPGQRVAVVTHAGVISQVLGILLGRSAAVWEPDRPEPLTATEVTWAGDMPRAVLTFNDPDWC